MIEIDGSILEGGGQILRVALSLSCILREPIHVYNIRAGRPKPGLQPQHSKGVELMQEISSARVEGNEIGSTEIKFFPVTIRADKYSVDIKTAGSIALLLQVALPVLYFTDITSVLDLKGGTNVDKAPQIDYVTEIFRPNLEKFNVTFHFELLKRGYNPYGGGHCEIIIEPVKKFNPVTITNFGGVKSFFGWSFVAGLLPDRLAHEMKHGALDAFNSMKLNVPINVIAYKENREIASKNCAGIILGCETSTGCTIGGSELCYNSFKTYDVGIKAGMEVVTYVQQEACVDSFTQDQLIIYMALADGTSRIKTTKPTLHTKTAIQIIELMCRAKFKIIDLNDETCIIECQGIGFRNNALY